MRLILLLLPFATIVNAAEPAPYDYKIFHKKFDSVYVLPAECHPERMIWSQADCSNDKVSAARRFSAEWGALSYWDGRNVVDNPDADKRVNARP
ncbi:MAG: hypothetical protein WCA48_22180 [Pseudomonas gingeri]